jgi:hypothetical protein
MIDKRMKLHTFWNLYIKGAPTKLDESCSKMRMNSCSGREKMEMNSSWGMNFI